MTRTPSVVDRLRPSDGGRIPFSVEFSPPRDEAAERRQWRAVRALISEGAPCLHFITLNFARATAEVLTNLGYAT